MKERLKESWEEIKSRPVYFVICALWFIIITVGIIWTLSSCKSKNEDNKPQSNTYVQIRMPDGNIIVGYADKVTILSDNYASITIGSTKYRTSPSNFIVIEEKN